MINTTEIEIAIMEHYDFRQNLMVPNVTPISSLVGFEADILMLTKAGYATCFEIKVSKSDLLNDKKKHHIKELNKISLNGKTATERLYKTLKHFVYVVPEKLQEVALETIPDFAGLVVATKYPDSYSPQRVFLKEVRDARKINNYKWSDKERYNLARLGAMRVYNLKQNSLTPALQDSKP